jgi:hypothetical protein
MKEERVKKKSSKPVKTQIRKVKKKERRREVNYRHQWNSYGSIRMCSQMNCLLGAARREKDLEHEN